MFFSLFGKKKTAKRTREDRSSRAVVGQSKVLRLAVSDLQVGMHVTKLDRPWLETPFVMQGFQIQTEQDIDEIERYCKYVYVDVVIEKRLATKEERKTGGRNSVKINYGSQPPAKNWGKEAAVYNRSRSLTKSILDEIRLGGTINTKAMKQIVNSVVESVISDPNSLIWLSRLSKVDEQMETHALSSCIMSVGFGRYLDFNEERMKKLGMSALLHDVGMTKLPADIVTKIHHDSQIDQKTYSAIKEHTRYGRDALAANEIYWGAVDVAYCHHERYDGAGYPRGLKGKAIPQFASIVSIVSTYEALTSPNHYKKAISSVDAIGLIYEEKGKQFHPILAKSFIRYIGLYPLGSIVELHTNEVGVVVAKNPYIKHLPTILIMLNSDGSKAKVRLLDLQAYYKEARNEGLFIKKAYPSGAFGIDSERLIREGIIDTDKKSISNALSKQMADGNPSHADRF